MQYNDVVVFWTVVEENSITKAANSLHFSQSTVSYRLFKLEEELGVQLLERNKGSRNIELTYYGEQFLPIARQWLRLYQHTRDLKNINANVLNIGAIESLSSSLLPKVYMDLVDRENPIQLHIMTKYSYEIYDAIENQQIDIGVVAIPESRKNVISIPIFDQKVYVVRYCEQFGPLRKVKPCDLDLNKEIYLRWGTEYDQWHEQNIGPITNSLVSLDSIMLLQQFLVRDGRWSLIPDNALQHVLSTFHNVQIDELDVEKPYSRRCYVVKNRYIRPTREASVEAFEKSLKKNFPQYPL